MDCSFLSFFCCFLPSYHAPCLVSPSLRSLDRSYCSVQPPLFLRPAGGSFRSYEAGGVQVMPSFRSYMKLVGCRSCLAHVGDEVMRLVWGCTHEAGGVQGMPCCGPGGGTSFSPEPSTLARNATLPSGPETTWPSGSTSPPLPPCSSSSPSLAFRSCCYTHAPTASPMLLLP